MGNDGKVVDCGAGMWIYGKKSEAKDMIMMEVSDKVVRCEIKILNPKKEKKEKINRHWRNLKKKIYENKKRNLASPPGNHNLPGRPQA